MAQTAVIGTGSWGIATAVALARGGLEVLLWGRDAAKVAALAAAHCHPQVAGDLPATLVITADASRLAGADLMLWAVPTQHTASSARALRDAIPAGIPLVSLAKGLEQGTLRRVSEILAAELPGRPVLAVSGPSHAGEVLSGKPACLVVAGPEAVANEVQRRLHGRAFRLYTSPDLLGVELAGAFKNVIAIAAGICDGLDLGHNVKAALVTRGVAEMRRLGRAMHAVDSTFSGMAGVGDLLTTCYSPDGRNRALGEALARGATGSAYLASRATVAEGAWTARAALELGRVHTVELPITSEVASLVWDDKPVAQALDALLARAPKEEDA